jgi:hypothetical protein
MPQPSDADEEVRSFVATLVKHDRIEFERPRKRGAARSSKRSEFPDHTTHVVAKVGGKKVLRRVRFACARCR